MPTVEHIQSPLHPLLPCVEKLYIDSFPADERREFSQIIEMIAHPGLFKLYIILNGEKFIGFITIHIFDHFVYGEHFAIHPEEQSKGYGSEIIRILKQEHTNVILEVEPPLGEIEQKRVRFYERAGFKGWTNIPYIQPPYAAGKQSLPMLLMTIGDLDLNQQPEVIAQMLKRVYKYG